MQTITFVPNGSWGWPDRAAIYTWTIYPAISAAGINTNLNSVTNGNVNNFTDLYFEKPWYGRITFLTWLDLANTGVQIFLENLSGYITMRDGYVEFNPIEGGTWFNVQAEILMDFSWRTLPFLWTRTADYITVRDASGNITGNDMISEVTCEVDGDYQDCYFTTDHFTSFELSWWFDCNNVTDISTGECQTLVNLYNTTNGDNRYSNDGWLNNYNVCSWYGVTCHDEMYSFNFFGSVYADWPGADYVEQLYLPDNNLSWMVNLSWLIFLRDLNLRENNISSINLAWLSNLTDINLSWNNMTDINFSWLNSLNNANVRENKLSQINLAWLPTLEYLYLSQNHLTTINLSWLVNLYELDLSFNRLSGLDLNWLTNIDWLRLNGNLLTTLPESTMDLTNLSDLYLNNNCRDISAMSWDLVAFLDDNAGGTNRHNITNNACYNNPEEVDALIDLYNATDGPNRDYQWNRLNRSVSVCNWAGVEQCHEGENYYEVAWLILKDNYLSGSVPESIGNLHGLHRLNLQYNNITSIPESIGTLTGINVLILDNNNLTSVPNTIGNLLNLWQLSLWYNQISSLPDTMWDLHNLMRLFIDNNRLTTLPDTMTYDNLPSMNSSYFRLRNNCIYQDHLFPDVLDFINNDMEAYWWDQEYDCPETTTNSSDGGTNYTGSVYFYDYTTGGISFDSTWDYMIYDGTDYLGFTPIWFTIEVIGGNRDGFLYAPNTWHNESAVFGETGILAQIEWTTTRTILMTVQAWGSWAALAASGGNFTVSFVVANGVVWDVLQIFRSSDGNTWEANTPDATCTLDGSLVCTFETDHLSYFAPIKTTTTSGGGGGSSSTSKDTCPDGDTSPSYYDGKCDMIGSTHVSAAKLWSITWSPFTTEINNAYLYAYNLGIVSSPTIVWADMEGKLIRSHMAKMMVNYAIKVMWLKPDTTKTCSFGDIGNQTSDLQIYIKLSCQLGLMWIGVNSFDPEATITRAQFGTVLSRTLFGDKYSNGKLYYTDHLQALKDTGIMNDISNPEWKKEIRGYVLLMMMRADK